MDAASGKRLPILYSPAAHAACPIGGVLILGQLAVAGAILADPLRALRTSPAEVVRFEGL